MRTYYLAVPKDEHGQPRQLFRANMENNIEKAIDQLSGICAGILADGIVSEAEANFFVNWVKKYSPYEPVWPFTDILSRVERIVADGRVDEEERQELRDLMASICGYGKEPVPEETYSTELPLDLPPPIPLLFENRLFNITGKFAFGTRRKVLDAIVARKGLASDSPPSRESHYLVLGTFASRDWKFTNYGRKIERAVKLRSEGTGIAIISEEHWRKFVT